MLEPEVTINVYENAVEVVSPEVSTVKGQDPTQFRNLVKQVSGMLISSEQAKQFLEVFGDALETELVKARRAFIEKHFGNRNTNQ